MIIGDRLRAIRDEKNLSQGNIETRTGLHNNNCDFCPVMKFLAGARPGTIDCVVTEVKRWLKKAYDMDS